jgi:hypothetical protein
MLLYGDDLAGSKFLRSSRLRAEHPARWLRFESPSLMADFKRSLSARQNSAGDKAKDAQRSGPSEANVSTDRLTTRHEDRVTQELL